MELEIHVSLTTILYPEHSNINVEHNLRLFYAMKWQNPPESQESIKEIAYSKMII